MPKSESYPHQQTNVKWESQDGKIVLYVDHTNRIFGTLFDGENLTHIYADDNTPGHIYIYPITFHNGEIFYWTGDRIHSDISLIEGTYRYNWRGKADKIKITIEVSTTDFEVGKTLVLYRTAENLAPEEIPEPPIVLPDYYYVYEKYKDLFEPDIFSLRKKSIIEKYGDFDFCLEDDYHEDCYYIIETDEEGNPKYLLLCTFNGEDGEVPRWFAQLGTPEIFGISDTLSQ